MMGPLIVVLVSSLVAAQDIQTRLDNDQTAVRKGLPEIFKRPLPVRSQPEPLLPGIVSVLTASALTTNVIPSITPSTTRTIQSSPTENTTPAFTVASVNKQAVIVTSTLASANQTTAPSSTMQSTMTTPYQNSTPSYSYQNPGYANPNTNMNAYSRRTNNNYANTNTYSGGGMQSNYGNRNQYPRRNYRQHGGYIYVSHQDYGTYYTNPDFWTLMTENDINDDNMFNNNF
ncbi:GATA zinc finger domain-containing protein 4-like [Paramacrobiotus metropolitanus]|uniref:GATA zinc finger domain-containing protein 4-like n=1 Tax=Paramacrobiotus metropolitanus TaxID=2943436 RepID=UPI00244582DC|nr:GATA zinc finger domain-containing protein 4-like [Paramacrobiotus metropolitanus]